MEVLRLSLYSHNDVLKLKSKGYIDLDWTRKDYLIKSIWLVLENADEVYEYLGREKRTEKVGRVVELIDNALEKISLDWCELST